MFTIVTLKDIADICGVSASTVSRAFDKSSRISDPVRKRILDCAAELGYTPNLIARGLKKSKTMTVAFIIPDIGNRFYINVIQHLEIILHQYGYRLLVTFVQNSITTERDCLEMAVSAHVDGIIIIPWVIENKEYIASLRENFKIIQLFTSLYPELDSVIMDDDFGAEIGVNYLIENNHKRILYLGDENRITGFWRAIDRAKISHDSVLTLPTMTTIDDLCTEITNFQPTAIFSISTASETAWQALRKLNLSIPDDISMITYDNNQWGELIGLTSVAHNLEELSSLLVKQLLTRLNGDTDSPAKHLVLNPFIIERDSVKKL